LPLTPGSRLGPYEILAPLGAGGMGQVYRARDPRLGREVAIKVLPELVARDLDALARFEREAKAVAALSHPNILSIFDFGTQDGTPYAVMEILEGESLSARLTSGPVPTKQAVDFALQIAKGLSAAHERGVIHRDLKPDNVFVGRDGHVKILDFGLAKRETPSKPGEETGAPTASVHTEPGTVMGTMVYMSPEQLRGLPADARSDLFSLGAILYELLSGQRAFKRNTASDTIAAILKEDPPELAKSGANVSPALDRVVRHCLEKERENRFQTARDVAFALSQASPPEAGETYTAPSKARMQMVAWMAAVLVVATATVYLWKRPKPMAPPAGPRRIAVLPFENLGLPEDDYFVDGMSDAVRAKLTSLKGIEVTARGSSVGYKKTSKTSKQIAKELDVPYLLTATVRWQKNGDKSRVEVTPELVEIRESGAPASRWQQPFDAALTDVFQVQADVATQVAQALGVALAAGDAKELKIKLTENLAAYDAYLKAMEYRSNSEFKEAKAALQRALALDPHFAIAMVMLAELSDREEGATLIRRAASERDHLTEHERYHVDILLSMLDGKPDQTIRLGRELHAKHPADGLGVKLLVREAIRRGDLDEAIRRYQELLAVDPKYSDPYNYIGYYYGLRGDYDEALKYLHKYEAMNAGSPKPHDSIGEIQAYCGHYNEAIENLNRALAIKPDFPVAYQHLGVAYEGLGDFPKAVAMYEKAATFDDIKTDRRSMLSAALRAALNGGDRLAALSLLDQIRKIPVDPRSEYAVDGPHFLLAVRDLIEDLPADAERRLNTLKPKMEALFADDQRKFPPPAFKPHFPEWNYLMARALEKQGRTDEALALYELNANPPNPFEDFEDRRWIMEGRAKVAEIVARKGDLDRAEKLIVENRKWNESWAPIKPSELVVEQLRRKNTR
jgi:TolB-like protein/Flp pilus assembly protein TadD